MFKNPSVALKQISKRDWELLEGLIYEGNADTFYVPEGFVTDFASVPRFASWLIPTYGLYTPASILHDYLWRNPGIVNHADMDGILRRTLREAGVSLPKRWMMWTAVRAGSMLKSINFLDFLKFITIMILSVAFLFIPVVLVQIWLIVFWLIELVFWSAGRLFGSERPRPIFEFDLTT